LFRGRVFWPRVRSSNQARDMPEIRPTLKQAKNGARDPENGPNYFEGPDRAFLRVIDFLRRRPTAPVSSQNLLD
jgi:hypothetical protein